MPLHLSTEAGVMRLILDDPDHRNALGKSAILAIAEQLELAARDASVRAVLIESASDAVFSSGAAGAEWLADPHDAAQGDHETLLSALRSFPKPVVAAVEGVAVGLGAQLLQWCDLVYVSEAAMLSLPLTALGLSPANGLSLLAGHGLAGRIAVEKILLSEPVTAQEAVLMGLATQAVERGQAAARARDRAVRLARLPALDVQAAKAALMAQRLQGLEAALPRELQLLAAATRDPESQEARKAFLAGRKPAFAR